MQTEARSFYWITTGGNYGTTTYGNRSDFRQQSACHTSHLGSGVYESRESRARF